MTAPLAIPFPGAARFPSRMHWAACDAVLTAAQIRTLNSAPVLLVPAPSPTSIIVPLWGLEIFTAGSVVFSASITPGLQIAADGDVWSQGFHLDFDGTVDVIGLINLDVDRFDNYVTDGGIGGGLYAFSGGDQTGGDGSTLRLLVAYYTVETGDLL